SSPSGYLILPRLLDSTYSFRLGFPGKNLDLDFSTTVNKKDHGYLIKNFGEKGWGLFDLQSLSIQMSSSKVKGTAEVNTNNTQVDAFTDLLSKAADDPSLKQNVVLVKEEEKKPEVTQAVLKEEKKPEKVPSDVVKSEEKKDAPDNANENKPPLAVSGEKKSEENPVADTKLRESKIVAADATSAKQNDSAGKAGDIRTTEVYKRSQVTKISGTATREGFESVFVDQYQNGKDTIRILIPGENKEVVVREEVTRPDSTKETRKFLDISSDTSQVINKPQARNKKGESIKWWPFGKNKDMETNKTQSATKNQEPKKWSPFGKNKNTETNKSQSSANDAAKKRPLFGNKSKISSNGAKKCENASNDDFLKLRRKMAGKTNDDGMLDEAGKYFKEKCFSTEQIKNLSSMFLSNAGKYNFFELAHNYVTDKENFSSLQSELKDEYYVNRFKTLAGN
ncbi:MAG TPA: DUF4476 domain-containing protein, partial [Chitinophagaceae bacterium]|nr:DUF4476 domain-containing protein [Chitinophagaceae bacterium]